MSDSLETGLVCHETIPLSWSVVAEASLAEAQSSVVVVNEERLRVINSLDDYCSEAVEDHPALSHELQKLDFKLNLILEMVGQLVSAGLQPQGVMPVVLSSKRLSWLCQEPPALGSWLKIELFLHDRYPFPVIFFGRVDLVEEEEQGSRVELALQPLSEQGQEQFEKYLFRCHRRQIARARHHSSGVN